MIKSQKLKSYVIQDPQAAKVFGNLRLALEGLNTVMRVRTQQVLLSPMKHLWNKTPLFKPSGMDTLATQYNGKIC